MNGAREPAGLRLTIRPNDFDSLGHVNNAVVLEYLEAGRWEWFARHGVQRWRSGTIVPVVARIEVDYRQEIVGADVVVHTDMVTDPAELSYRARFHQTVVLGGSAAVAVEARVEAAFITVAGRELRSFQDFLEANAVSL